MMQSIRVCKTSVASGGVQIPVGITILFHKWVTIDVPGHVNSSASTHFALTVKFLSNH